jgi:hypothetical protein
MPFVSITRLRLRSWQYLRAFLLQSLRLNQPGLLFSGRASACSPVDTDENLIWGCRLRAGSNVYEPAEHDAAKTSEQAK